MAAKIKKLTLFVFIVITTASISSCEKKVERISEPEIKLNDYIVEMTCNNMRDVNISTIDSLIHHFKQTKETRKIGHCYLLRGTVLYDQMKYRSAMSDFKKAESYIDETDTLCAILYKNLAEILNVSNPDESRVYVEKLHNLATLHNDTAAEIEANIIGICLTDNYNTACKYRNENIELCYAIRDTAAILRTNAKFAYTFAGQIQTDSAISLILPYYEVTKSAYDAELIASLYLAADRPDLARPYIDAIAADSAMNQHYTADMASYYYLTDSCLQGMRFVYRSFEQFVANYNEAYDENIARINAWQNRIEAEQVLMKQTERHNQKVLFIKTITLILILVIIASTYYFVVLRLQQRNNAIEAKKRELIEKEEALQRERERVELEKKYHISNTKLSAMTNICRQTLTIAAQSDVNVSAQIAKILKKQMQDIYPNLTETDWQYLFLAYTGLSKTEGAKLLGVNRNTINWRISQLRGKLNLEPRAKLTNILDKVFFTEK